MQSPFSLSQSWRWLGAGYILLTVLQAGLLPPLLFADCLAPLLAAAVLWQWRRAAEIVRESHYTLPAFLTLALATSIYHICRGSGWVYDFAVFAYMALLYLAFRLLPLGEKLQLRLGWAVMLLLLAGFIAGALSFCFPPRQGLGLFYLDPHSGARGLSFLAVRYQFLFPNPNLLGSFYILPVALLQPYWRRLCRSCRTPWQWLLLFLGAGLLLLPLFATASKHILMTLALLAGTLVEAWPEKRRLLLPPAIVALLLLALVSLLTVLWPVFPLSRQFPWINVRHQGNYTIHQEIYLKMLSAGKLSWLTGLGATAARQRYPDYADRAKITRIMDEYHSPHCVEPYCTYMDPHNEYLNLTALFGLPAAVCCFAFWISQKKKARWGLSLFLLAMLFCCLWDDLLSKRWLWVALAVMVLNACPENKSDA